MKYRFSDTHKEPKLEDFGVPEDYGQVLRPTAQERKQDLIDYCRKMVPQDEQAIFWKTVMHEEPEVWALMELAITERGRART